ncbi:TPA: SLATT domain-containing protein [Aeromonas veronii]
MDLSKAYIFSLSIKEFIQKTFNIAIMSPITWLFSLQQEEKDESDPAKKLLNSMRITAKCRFNAAVRLLSVNSYSFITTTVLSLGLIFIPLYQSSGLPVPYSDKVLSMLQIFLAVAVLVYSVIIGTSKYELRASKLDKCGVDIKVLIRKLRNDICESKASGVSINLEKYHNKYHVISSESENHSRLDYLQAILDTRSDFDITGIKRAYLYLKMNISKIKIYILPTTMMLFEILFILDIIGITECFRSVLVK